MHAHIGNANLVLHGPRGPLFISFDYELGIVVNRAMAGRHNLYVVCRNLIEVFHYHTAKRHHYFSKISLGSCLLCRLILRIELARGKVRAEEIAGEEDLVFFQICEHRFRPMNPRRVNKPQCPSSKIDHVSVLHGDDPMPVYMQKIDEHLYAFRRADYFGLRIHFQYFRNRS